MFQEDAAVHHDFQAGFNGSRSRFLVYDVSLIDELIASYGERERTFFFQEAIQFVVQLGLELAR